MASKNRPKKIKRKDKHVHPSKEYLEKMRKDYAEMKKLDRILPIEIMEYDK